MGLSLAQEALDFSVPVTLSETTYLMVATKASVIAGGGSALKLNRLGHGG